MTKREMEQRRHMRQALDFYGVTRQDFEALRRISMTLGRWFEREAGDGHDCIKRDDETGKTYWVNAKGKGYPIPDRETSARKRLAAIMARYPKLTPYVQGDARGAALYILRPLDVPEGERADSYYTRGICVF